MSPSLRVPIALLTVLLIATSIRAQSDRSGSSDHPLISRMPDFWIAVFKQNAYESHAFRDRNDLEVSIEGHYYYIEYRLKKGGQEPGRLMILDNHENALKGIAATTWRRGKSDLYAKVENEGQETWIQVHALDSLYRLTIVERTTMEQKVTVDSDALLGDLATTGHAAVYGIYFAHDSADINQESRPSLEAIADMLKANTSLRLYVVGHTDMTGQFDYNLGLSLKRAQAVVKALVNEYGIAAVRLAGKGAGPLCPVGSNKNESGRKLNRRVELVEM